MKYYCIIVFFLIACIGGSKTGQSEDSENEKSPSLISWSNEFAMKREQEDFSYYDDHKNFISKYFSVNFYDKRIVATTLIQINCIDSIVGKIEISHDTIFLKSDVIITDDRHCNEFHKFKFTIRNPKNVKYKIISTK